MPTQSKAATTPKPLNKLSIGLRCGDCLHFKGPANRNYSDKCSRIGIASYSKPCKFFSSDISKIGNADGSTELFAAVANASKGLSDQQMRLLAYSLLQQKVLKKIGLRLGQPLYVYLPATLGTPRDIRARLEKYDLHYADQYYKGYVIGFADHGDTIEVFISPKEAGKPDPYTISLAVNEEGKLPPYVLGVKKFKARQAELLEEGKARMPKDVKKAVEKILALPFRTRPIIEEDAQTIDTVPAHFWTRGAPDEGIGFSSRKKRKKKSKAESTKEAIAKVSAISKRTKIKRKGASSLTLSEI